MDHVSSDGKDWTISQDTLDSLLRHLDSDRERAGEKYEKIREKLIKLFRWRGCVTPEDYADRTIDRVCRRIQEGIDLRSRDVYSYFHGVALNVLREHWKEPARKVQPLDTLLVSPAFTEDPLERIEWRRNEEREQLRLDCLGRCVKELAPDKLDLIARYHLSTEGRAMQRRAELAAEMQVPLNALRIRVYRIRLQLENCLKDCLSETPQE